jgi:hypothetical protein
MLKNEYKMQLGIQDFVHDKTMFSGVLVNFGHKVFVKYTVINDVFLRVDPSRISPFRPSAARIQPV